MKRVKVILFMVVISVIVVAVFQNQDFFMDKSILSIDFYFIKYKTPFLSNILMFFFCFTVGFLISFISSISYKVKSEKVTKLLRSREASLLKVVSNLRGELDKIKTSNDFQGTKNFDADELNK